MPEAPPLAVTGAVLDGETVGLRCEGGAIVAIGAGAEPEPGDEIVDAAGALLVAPLVNGHTHAAMTLFPGYGGDPPPMRWLPGVGLPGGAEVGPAAVYSGPPPPRLGVVRR